MTRKIPPQYVAKVDQDLTAARANLRLHLADFERLLTRGDSPETVFAGFAQAMVRETNPYHTAIMFSAAVLTLFEKRAEQNRMVEFTLLVRTIGTTPVLVQVHEKCGRDFVIAVESGPTQAHFRVAAEEHLRSCEA